MKKNKIITYVIALFAFLIPAIIYLTPPTDFDGGPMMAYNFTFFFPLLLLSIILSIIVIFRLKYFGKEVYQKIILLILILPSFRLIVMVLINISSIANEPEILDLEIPNNSVNVKVNDSLEVKLEGSTKRTMGKNEEIIEEKIINLVPYVDGKYRFEDGGNFISSSKNQEIFYSVINDSLSIFNYQFKYNFFNKNRISLPFKIENIETQKVKEKTLETNGFKKFIWK